jgi:hypothetical protein
MKITKDDVDKRFKNLKNHRITVGFTKIDYHYNKLEISHGGNMGNSIEKSVNPNLKLVQFPTIEELKESFEVLYEDGSPDYYYLIIFNIE